VNCAPPSRGASQASGVVWNGVQRISMKSPKSRCTEDDRGMSIAEPTGIALSGSDSMMEAASEFVLSALCTGSGLLGRYE
jgi:hypothetical protein